MSGWLVGRLADLHPLRSRPWPFGHLRLRALSLPFVLPFVFRFLSSGRMQLSLIIPSLSRQQSSRVDWRAAVLVGCVSIWVSVQCFALTEEYKPYAHQLIYSIQSFGLSRPLRVSSFGFRGQSSTQSPTNFMRKIDINTADEHTAEYHHIFIWTMVVKHQTKRKMMLNNVFVLFYTHKRPNHAFKRI